MKCRNYIFHPPGLAAVEPPNAKPPDGLGVSFGCSFGAPNPPKVPNPPVDVPAVGLGASSFFSAPPKFPNVKPPAAGFGASSFFSSVIVIRKFQRQ